MYFQCGTKRMRRGSTVGCMICIWARRADSWLGVAPMTAYPFAEGSGPDDSSLTNFDIPFVCPQADCANVTKNRVVQILSFMSHLQACAGGELGAGSKEAQWTAD